MRSTADVVILAKSVGQLEERMKSQQQQLHDYEEKIHELDKFAHTTKVIVGTLVALLIALIGGIVVRVWNNS